MNENIKNIVVDTNYTEFIENWWFPKTNQINSDNNWWNINDNTVVQEQKEPKKKGFFDSFVENLTPKKWDNTTTKTEEKVEENDKKNENKTEKKGFFDKLVDSLFPTQKTNKWKNNSKIWDTKETPAENIELKNMDLKDQVKAIIEMPDSEYSDKKLTSDLRKYISEVEKRYTTTINDYKTHIAPSFWIYRCSMD